jgi:hypothetical protein
MQLRLWLNSKIPNWLWGLANWCIFQTQRINAKVCIMQAAVVYVLSVAIFSYLDQICGNVHADANKFKSSTSLPYDSWHALHFYFTAPALRQSFCLHVFTVQFLNDTVTWVSCDCFFIISMSLDAKTLRAFEIEIHYVYFFPVVFACFKITSDYSILSSSCHLIR